MTATQGLVRQLLTGEAGVSRGTIIDVPDEATDDYLDDTSVSKQLRRQVDLNGQETWQDTEPQALPAAGGGAMSMPPVPGGVPGFTAGAEPPRWDGSSPQPRVLSTPDDGDDGMYPDAGRVRSERPHGVFPSGPQGMDGYWPQGQPQQQQSPESSPGGKRGVPPSTVGSASSQANEREKVKKANLEHVSGNEATLTGSHDTALEPSVIKVGPEGYIHGWIRVNAPVFHGTSAILKPGDLVEAGHPAVSRDSRLQNTDKLTGKYNHMSTSIEIATRYAERAANAARNRIGRLKDFRDENATGHVYEVAPDNLVEADPDGRPETDFRSSYPLRVIREVPLKYEANTKPSVTKVGAEGYIHDWIKVGPGDGEPQDPARRQQAVDDWVGLGGKRKTMVKPADVLAALKGESSNESANILAKELVSNSRPAKEVMYRGLAGKPESRAVKSLLTAAKRGTIDLGPSSFTEDEEVAHDFMGGAYPGSGKIGIQINARKMTGIPMKSSANQMDMGGYTEREWLTGGRYKVTGMTGPDEDGGYVIDVEQTHGFGDA